MPDVPCRAILRARAAGVASWRDVAVNTGSIALQALAIALSCAACSVDTRAPGVGAGGSSSSLGGAPSGGAPALAGTGGTGGSAGLVASAGGARGESPSPAIPDAPLGTPEPPDAGPALPAMPEAPPGGYFESGGWRGFVSVATDSLGTTTVVPLRFDEHAAGEPYCIRGTVGPDDLYSGFVALMFALEQPVEVGTGGAASAVVPAGQGVRFSLSSRGGGVLRAELSGGGRAWCRGVSELVGDVAIGYPEFREMCWLPAGQSPAYAGEPVDHVSFVVPGGAIDPVPFDFCIDALAELP